MASHNVMHVNACKCAPCNASQYVESGCADFPKKRDMLVHGGCFPRPLQNEGSVSRKTHASDRNLAKTVTQDLNRFPQCMTPIGTMCIIWSSWTEHMSEPLSRPPPVCGGAWAARPRHRTQHRPLHPGLQDGPRVLLLGPPRTFHRCGAA